MKLSLRNWLKSNKIAFDLSRLIEEHKEELIIRERDGRKCLEYLDKHKLINGFMIKNGLITIDLKVVIR
jgi:hypothetical protein